MNPPYDTRESNVNSLSIGALVNSILEQFDVVMGRPDRVAEICGEIKARFSSPLDPDDIEAVRPLLSLLARRSGPLAQPLFDFFEEITIHVKDPRILIEGLLACQDNSQFVRTLNLTLALSDNGVLVVDHDLVRFLANCVGTHEGDENEEERYRLIGTLVGRYLDEGGDGLRSLLLCNKEWSMRRLAARLLDMSGEPAPMEICRDIVDEEAYRVLCRYFTYTRISHFDLLSLISADAMSELIPLFREAEEVMGETVLREVIAEVGWSGLNLGVTVLPRVRVSIGATLPLFLSPSEAALFEEAGAKTEEDGGFLIVAHGSDFPTGQNQEQSDDPAKGFRLLNLAHADILADFLAIAPLTMERIHDLIMRMDAIVNHHVALFASFSNECTILPAIYSELKTKILAQLPSQDPNGTLSPNLTRLVMMFEDPCNAGEVRTLHGLKRYLHQKGLQLGFKLVLRSRSTNRRVCVMLASKDRILQAYHGIRYMDFEPDSNEIHPKTEISYPVKLVVDGFGRQMWYGQESFPRVDIFCYGNEIHYYLAFRNHPAFVRINYAPPLQGGMIDLEYFGISKNELSVHPNITLDALKRFFKNLEFDIRIESTRVRARYDKEQAHNLETLCEKAAIFFCLAPYLLDIDWTIGSLSLPQDARDKTSEAWARHFLRWGVLPLKDLLTADRQGIVEAIENTVTGRSEKAWSGEGPYRDRFSGPAAAGFIEHLSRTLESLGMDISSVADQKPTTPADMMEMERSLIQPMREAVLRGQWKATNRGFETASPECYGPLHEAEYFADILASGDDAIVLAARIAALVVPLEKYLNFSTTGHVQGYDVQVARLHLKGTGLGIFVLRDERNLINLAFFAHGMVLFRRREQESLPWTNNASLDAILLAGLLRRANYPVEEVDGTPATTRSVKETLSAYRHAAAASHREPLPGEHILTGLRASPGHAVGEAVLGTSGKKPEDFFERLLVAPSIRPDDAPFMYRAAGIISTGGGILSHAGLMAAQFKKPAMIIQGRWDQLPGGFPILRYLCMEYRLEQTVRHGYRVEIRKNLKYPEHELHNGDLLVLDTVDGTLQVLGQARDTISLHEAFRSFWKAAGQLALASTDADILAWRGQQLRARYQIEKTMIRLRDPVLACFAIRQLLMRHDTGIGTADRAALIQLILTNPDVRDVARKHLAWIGEELRDNFFRQWNKAIALIPMAYSIFEVLVLRRDALSVRQKLDDCKDCLHKCGLPWSTTDLAITSDIESAALERLERFREQLLADLALDGLASATRRHLLRQVERTNALLGSPGAHIRDVKSLQDESATRDTNRCEELKTRFVIGPGDGGLELGPVIGWKAANLAEVGRLLGGELVPPWFAITDKAFRQILESPVHLILPEQAETLKPASSLKEAIEQILQSSNTDLIQKSARIRALWEAVILPDDLVQDITMAHQRLTATAVEETQDVYVALRSSSHEEDEEIAARAGEFDTFLYLQNIKEILAHLKRTWSGLWGERAMHNRAAMGIRSSAAGGGVIVQRMVNARVSGVLQTINVGQNEMREIVINAGIGLGEGIVSGVVAADHIVVSKDPGPGPLRFSYLTADKREQIVFNRRTGMGTIRCELPYHRRLRPALEYVELHELVSIALQLEKIYGYPLDIEFAIEATRLWILQVRPVPVYLSVINDTIEKYPLTIPRMPSRGRS